MSPKLPFAEPTLTEESSLTEITLVSGDDGQPGFQGGNQNGDQG